MLLNVVLHQFLIALQFIKHSITLSKVDLKIALLRRYVYPFLPWPDKVILPSPNHCSLHFRETAKNEF